MPPSGCASSAPWGSPPSASSCRDRCAQSSRYSGAACFARIFPSPLRQVLVTTGCTVQLLSAQRRAKTESLERGTGFEPATIALEERDSTVELPPPGRTQSNLPAGREYRPHT